MKALRSHQIKSETSTNQSINQSIKGNRKSVPFDTDFEIYGSSIGVRKSIHQITSNQQIKSIQRKQSINQLIIQSINQSITQINQIKSHHIKSSD